ncbi:unnamed protein product, partial [Rotaria sordida]
MGDWFATKNLKGIVSLTNGYLNGRPENGTQQQKHFASALAKYEPKRNKRIQVS